jgi:tRNA G10  N-methylase Trm11
VSEYRLILGDCLSEMKALPADSVDAVVTDPPAGISFMGKAWDHDRGGRRLGCARRTCNAPFHRVVAPGPSRPRAIILDTHGKIRYTIDDRGTHWIDATGRP